MMEMDTQDRQDNDFKYIMQDTGNIYLGARYSYTELLGHEMIPFKLKTIITQYLLKDVDASTTLESHFYYMDDKSFACQTYLELKVKIKVCLPVEKKTILGKSNVHYVEKLYSLKDFLKMSPEQKQINSMIVREVAFSKIGLLSFAV